MEGLCCYSTYEVDYQERVLKRKEMREDTGNISIEVAQLPLPDLETEQRDGLYPVLKLSYTEGTHRESNSPHSPCTKLRSGKFLKVTPVSRQANDFHRDTTRRGLSIEFTS